MTQVIVDDILLREPNLLVPGMKPIGPVKVDWTHSIPRDYQLLSTYLFRSSTDHLTAVNTTATPFLVYDAAQERLVDWVADYPNYFKWSADGKGQYLLRTTSGTTAYFMNEAAPFSAYRWQAMLDNSEYTFLMSGKVLTGVAGISVIDAQVNRHIQINSQSWSDTAQTMRFINNAVWAVGYDDIFSQDIATVGNDLFIGMSWNGNTGYRGAHFGDELKTRTIFSGALQTSGYFGFLKTDASLGLTSPNYSPRYLHVFAKSLPAHIVDEIRLDPYQFLIPA